MAGENSLSSVITRNLESLEAGCTQENLNGGNLLVYVDSQSNAPCLYQIKPGANGEGERILIQEYEESNSVSPETMRNIIRQVSEQFPAQGMGLILWSHGTAWLPSNLTSYLRYFGQDGQNYMEINELSEVLNDFHFDFLAFDACYMGSIEVAYALKDCADYLIASPTEILSAGFPYNQIVQPMFASTANVTDIAQRFYNYYNEMSGMMQSASISVIRNEALEEVATACYDIFSHITGEELWNVPLQDVQILEYLSNNYHSLYDFDDYVAHLTSNHPELYTHFQNALNQCVIYKASTSKNYFSRVGMVSIENYSGLSVYAPQQELPKLNTWYQQLSWWNRVYTAWPD